MTVKVNKENINYLHFFNFKYTIKQKKAFNFNFVETP